MSFLKTGNPNPKGWSMKKEEKTPSSEKEMGSSFLVGWIKGLKKIAG
jgi:hypothetical protein